MLQGKKLKLFISYSHKDNCDGSPHVEQFKKHLSPFKDNGLIEEWYDREILPGQDYQNKIDNKLEDADIICLFISANFLSSENCKKEKKAALNIKKNKGISIVPIILSPCGWIDDADISKLLALPKDGNPVSKYPNQDDAWYEIYLGLKKLIENDMAVRRLAISEIFEPFLHDTEILTKAHSQKEMVLLEDIFVYPELDKFDALREYDEKISSEVLLNNLIDYPKIVIAGEDQSGKTSLCKMIFKELRKSNYAPVYVSCTDIQFTGKMDNIILRSFSQQYAEADIDRIDRKRIIPIVDDFHCAKNKERYLDQLNSYPYTVLIVDDIFALNVQDERLIRQYDYFKIREFKASLRDELIKKWTHLTNKEIAGNYTENNFYKEIDKNTELINNIMGRIVGRGIFPSFPFFILSAIVAYETFMPLDQEITSQGYCYQALIYFYLRKMGVKNEDIDIYINFLTEVAFCFYKEKKSELLPDEFSSFMRSYLKKYNLPIKQDLLLRNLKQIISVDSFNNYSFRYRYLYYFFVAKYLSEHITEHEIENEIDKITKNLHINENAYILISIAHHSRSNKIIDGIELNALCMFDKFTPATLTKNEVKFFDDEADAIIKAALPPASVTPENKRSEILKLQDETEQIHEKDEKKEDENTRNPLEMEIRRAIKTMEVMGCIIKNRAGSLEKTKLEEMFKEAMNLHLRVLSSFFEIIKKEDQQKSIVDYLSKKLEKIIEEKDKMPSRDNLEKISRTIFWNLNFFILYGIIHKIVHSLGSDKLYEIVRNVCGEINTPVSFAIEQGFLMWHNKNLRIDDIAERLKEKDFSEIAKKVIKLMVVNHCSMHQTSYKDRQKIENKLNIPTKKLLSNYYKNS